MWLPRRQVAIGYSRKATAIGAARRPIDAMSDVRVSGLTIYPVKSCAGIDVDAVTVTETGFMYDRAWMLVESRKPKPRSDDPSPLPSPAGTDVQTVDDETTPTAAPKPEKRRAKPRASVFVTQRTEPKLALVSVALPTEVLSPNWDGILPPEAAMTITAPGMRPLAVPLAPDAPLPRCKVGVWEWEGLAGDEGSAASEWFTRYLGKTKSTIRLVRWLGDGALPPAVANPSRRTASIHDLANMDEKSKHRRDDPKVRKRRATRAVLASVVGAGAAVGAAGLARIATAPAPSLAATAVTAALVEMSWSFLSRWRRLTLKPRRPTDGEFSAGHTSAFSDGYPVLLISDASLRGLNEKLKTPVPMNRFRPNVTVDGCEPFAEDGWGAVVFGGVKSVVTTPRVYKETKTRIPDLDDFDIGPAAAAMVRTAKAKEGGDNMEDEARLAPRSPGWEKKLGVEVRKRRSVRIKTGVPADLVKPCSRCVMTTVDQSTGVRGGLESDPLKTLGEIRSGKTCGFSTETYKPEWSDEAFFGWNLCCNAKVGSKIRVGDVVTVTKRREFVKPK